IEESRITRLFQDSTKNHRIENLDIVSFNLDFEKQTERSEIRYGAEAYANFVASNAFARNIYNGETNRLDTRYPDGGSRMTGLAAYFTQSWELGKKKRIVLSDGLRFSKVDLFSRFIDQTFFNFPFSQVSQSNEALTGHLGMVFNASKKNRYHVNFSTGFRAPNVDDLSKVFESTAGTVIVPNPNLSPEYAYNGELGYAHTFYEKFTVSGLVYGTLLNNALSVQEGTFNGSSTIFYEGELSQVVQLANNQQAFVTGFEGGVSGDIYKHFAVYGNINLTKGRIIKDTTVFATTPLAHIPPM
ncbi:unnamed protein product, partial [Chrysoparadoxa australica]